MLPQTIDNEYRGHRVALWIFGLLLAMKALMSLNSIFNGFYVAANADGIPLGSYPGAAARTIVALFAVFGLAHLTTTVLSAIALFRYRSLVPFFYGVLLFEHVARRVILRVIPIDRVGNPPAGMVNMFLIGLMIAGLALALRRLPIKAAVAAACLFVLPLGAQPNDAEAMAQLGREAMTRGEPVKAVEHFEKAVSLKPKDAKYHYELANACGVTAAKSGMFAAMSMGKRMKEELDRAVALDPNALPARFMLLEFHLMAPSIFGGDKSAAEQQAAAIRKRDPIEGHRAFARIHTAAKRPDLARREYEEMVNTHAQSARAHSRRWRARITGSG